MIKKIIIYFSENPATYYYLGFLIILFGGLFVSALIGYVISMMES
jgi:hypothetical protein